MRLSKVQPSGFAVSLSPETSMTHLIAALCLLLISTSAIAELGPQAITLSGMSDCLKEAIGNNSVEQNGNTLFFSCSEAKAKILFNLLARKIRAEVVQDPNGKFENRQFGNSACYHRVEDAAGKPADDFRCDLVILTGDALLD
jgi:hypothetical protein